MEENNSHGQLIAAPSPQKPLGRMLVPLNQEPDEQPKMKKKRRQRDGNERRRLIVHIVILVILLTIIGYGVYDFVHEPPNHGVPRAADATQVDSDSLSQDD